MPYVMDEFAVFVKGVGYAHPAIVPGQVCKVDDEPHMLTRDEAESLARNVRYQYKSLALPKLADGVQVVTREKRTEVTHTDWKPVNDG